MDSLTDLKHEIERLPCPWQTTVESSDRSLEFHDVTDHAALDRASALTLRAVHEGYLNHYGKPNLQTDPDRDFRLLIGDRLYALAVERLAADGDLAGVVILSDLIASVARAHATGDHKGAQKAWDSVAELFAYRTNSDKNQEL